MSLLRDFTTTQCRDPHDLIYALIGAAQDTHLNISKLKPDYSKDVEDIFRELTIEYLTEAQDLRVLHQIRSLSTIVPNLLPTFVPDWREPEGSSGTQFGGLNPQIFKAGIGERLQPVQVRLTSTGYPEIFG